MSENKKVWFVSDHHFGHELMRKMRNFETTRYIVDDARKRNICSGLRKLLK